LLLFSKTVFAPYKSPVNVQPEILNIFFSGELYEYAGVVGMFVVYSRYNTGPRYDDDMIII
jgi:hypothetical protein